MVRGEGEEKCVAPGGEGFEGVNGITACAFLGFGINP
jgi:hypothetical protein